MHRRVALAVLVLILSGCGPKEIFGVSVHSYPENILYGSAHKPIAPPLPPPAPGANLTALGSPGFIQPPPPVDLVQPSPLPATSPSAAPTCPTADPLAPAQTAAGSASAKGPADATETLRDTGTWSLLDSSGKPTQTGRFPNATTRRITTKVSQPLGPTSPASGVNSPAWTFDVVDDGGGSVGTTTVTTTYSVYPSDRTFVGDTNFHGVTISQIRDDYSDGTFDQFVPRPEVEFFRYPVAPGTDGQWSNQGADPLLHTTMSISGSVVGRGRVDACGTVLDAWHTKASVTISQAGGNKSIQVTAEYWIGTEYGSVSLQDRVHMEGTDHGQPFKSDNTVVINSQPKLSG